MILISTQSEISKHFLRHCTRKYHIWWVERKLQREEWCIEFTQMLWIKCLELTHCVAVSTKYVWQNILSSFDFVGKVNIYSPLSGLVATLSSYKKGRIVLLCIRIAKEVTMNTICVFFCWFLFASVSRDQLKRCYIENSLRLFIDSMHSICFDAADH